MAFFISICCAFPLFANQSESHVEPLTNKIYFSLSNDYGAPLTSPKEIFDCSDKIYTVVELGNYPHKKHHLSVRWKNPSGGTQEHTQYDFNVRQKDTRIWAWLTLSRAAGAGMLQFVNPSAGLDEFLGIWTVEVKVDNKLIDTGTFEVSC